MEGCWSALIVIDFDAILVSIDFVSVLLGYIRAHIVATPVELSTILCNQVVQVLGRQGRRCVGKACLSFIHFDRKSWVHKQSRMITP